jgi:hypothetical protein
MLLSSAGLSCAVAKRAGAGFVEQDVSSRLIKIVAKPRIIAFF